MEPREWTNDLMCLNCGSIVDWKTFQCDACGRNPRVKEPVFEICFPLKHPASESLERRKYARHDVQGVVILNGSSRGELIDLCERGARFKTSLRLFRDEFIHVDFSIRGVLIHVKARVIHVQQGVLDERFTLGVYFETMTRDHSELLCDHLREISEERRGDPPRL